MGLSRHRFLTWLTATTGVGLFDWRGATYQSPGFRGVYDKESSRFFIAIDAPPDSS